MSDENKDWLKQLFKGLGLIVVIFLLVVVVGFGLLVGFCALASHR